MKHSGPLTVDTFEIATEREANIIACRALLARLHKFHVIGALPQAPGMPADSKRGDLASNHRPASSDLSAGQNPERRP